MTAVRLVFAGVSGGAPIAGGSSEADAYEAAIISAGGTLSAAQKEAARVFIARGITDGWWDKIIDCGLFLGSNLAAGLVKLKAAPTTGTSYTNHNFLEGDYGTTTGLTTGPANATKYLSTDVVPSDQSLSINDLSHGLGMLNPTVVDNYLMGDNPSAGLNTAIFARPPISMRAMAWTRSYCGAVSYGASLVRGAMDGVSVQSFANGATDPVEAEITLFKVTSFGTEFFGSGTVTFAFIGPELTAADLRSITAAARRVHVAARDGSYALRYAVVGDSITANNWGWINTVAANHSMSVLNLAASSTYWLQDVDSGLGGKNRLVGINAFPVDRLFIAMGTNDINNSDGTTDGDASLISNYRDTLATACATLITYGIEPIIVSIAWMGTANETKLLAWTDGALGAATDAGVVGVDVCRAMIDAGVEGDPTMFYDVGAGPDYIHPNEDGHAFIASVVEAAL